jgi:hypothetical protein
VTTVTFSVGQTRLDYARNLAELIAPEYGTTADAILFQHTGKRRQPQHICEARQIVMWRCRMEGWGWTEVGALFGMDHSTAWHAAQRVALRRSVDREVLRITDGLPPYRGRFSGTDDLKDRLSALDDERAQILARLREIEHPLITRVG